MISGFWQKLGFWSKDLINNWTSKKDWLWFHAVSVGELKAIWPLILEIKKTKNSYPIMISTTTRAGYKLANELTANKDILVFYFPFDLSYIVKSLLNYAKIKILIIAETEIWPTLLSECHKHKIPTVLVNARLSDKSFKNYKAFKFYFKNIVNLFTKILAQSDTDAKKYLDLGAKPAIVETIGNLKFAGFNYNNGNSKNKATKIDDSNTTKIIFASTHKGEEKLAIEVYKDLIKEFDNLRLIIAPRHIERIEEIKNLINKEGFSPIFKTSNQLLSSNKDIFVLDTIGELISFYKIADITVLCGTFADIGGHNILEPIKSGSFTIIGPHDYKIKEISSIFKNEYALVQVQNKEELIKEITEVLKNKNLINTYIQKGIKIIDKNENIIGKVTNRILSYIQ